MARPSYQGSSCSEYFYPNTPVSIPGGTTWLLAVFRDETGSDGTSGFTQAGNPMTKITGYFSGGNGWYGAYTTTPVPGSQPINWVGVVGGYASARYTVGMSDVTALDGSGFGYNAPQVGETSHSIAVPSTIDSTVIAFFALSGPQVPATLTAHGLSIITTGFVGDGRYIVMIAPGAPIVNIGFTSSVPNFSVLGGWACSVRGPITSQPFVKLRIKLRGT